MKRCRGAVMWLAGWVCGIGAAQAPPARDVVARDLLEAHNTLRRRVGVPPLRWSALLEGVAREWAGELLASGALRHRPDADYGENLYEIRGRRAAPREVVSDWAAEAVDFDARRNVCRPGAVCGHYTQIVWRDTARVGCAVAGDRTREVWVCEYDPEGNWVGRRPY